jgi:hypothetical protein
MLVGVERLGGVSGEPGRQVRTGVQESFGEALRRTHGSERRDFRPVYERRTIPKDRDRVDGVGSVSPSTQRRRRSSHRRDGAIDGTGMYGNQLFSVHTDRAADERAFLEVSQAEILEVFCTRVSLRLTPAGTRHRRGDPGRLAAGGDDAGGADAAVCGGVVGAADADRLLSKHVAVWLNSEGLLCVPFQPFRPAVGKVRSSPIADIVAAFKLQKDR